LWVGRSGRDCDNGADGDEFHLFDYFEGKKKSTARPSRRGRDGFIGTCSCRGFLETLARCSKVWGRNEAYRIRLAADRLRLWRTKLEVAGTKEDDLDVEI
jgi:hypothetical protein